jgi:hypothetical protein
MTSLSLYITNSNSRLNLWMKHYTWEHLNTLQIKNTIGINSKYSAQLSLYSPDDTYIERNISSNQVCPVLVLSSMLHLSPSSTKFINCRDDNRKRCWWWHLMEHTHNNLMQLGGSLGNVRQKLKKLVIKTRYISDCWSIFKSTLLILLSYCRDDGDCARWNMLNNEGWYH